MANRTSYGYVADTIQSNIHTHTNETILDYSLFAGGVDASAPSLQQWDPLKTGYSRLFMVRQPWFMRQVFPSKMKKFKHIIEYGNVSVQGIGDTTLQTVQLTGGVVGRSLDLPTIAQNDTNQITITVYELSGSPIREVIWAWINGMADELSGFTTYFGIIEIDGSHLANQAHQVAEFIYVSTDCTGWNIEFACMLANCFPTNVKNDHFNFERGNVGIVEYPIEFRAYMHQGTEINQVAKKLLDKYRIIMFSIDFCSKLSGNSVDLGGGGTEESGANLVFGSEFDNDPNYWTTRVSYNPATGKLINGDVEGNTYYPPNLGSSIFAQQTVTT